MVRGLEEVRRDGQRSGQDGRAAEDAPVVTDERALYRADATATASPATTGRAGRTLRGGGGQV